MSVVNYLNAAGAKSGKDERVEYYKKFFGEDGGDAKFSWVWNERLHKELLVRYGTDKAKLAADTRRILEGQEPETPASAPAARPKDTTEPKNETPEMRARREAAEGREREYADAVFYQMQDPAEAVKKVKQAPPDDGKVHILDIPSTPPKVANPQAWDKKYAFIHGGCNATDKSLIWTGAERGNFAYCVTTKGWVCRFWPDGLGQGAIGSKGMVNGDANAAERGIGIEFSAKKHPKIAGETKEPNAIQRVSGGRLIKFLAHKYPELWCSTSWKAVDGEVGVHGDTRTWSRQVYIDMGLDPNELLERMPKDTSTWSVADAQALATAAKAKAKAAKAKWHSLIQASWEKTAKKAWELEIQIAQVRGKHDVASLPGVVRRT